MENTAASRPDRPRNRLLEMLPDDDYALIAARMGQVSVRDRDVICDVHSSQSFAHFPVSGVASALVIMEDGTSIETMMIGNEGMIGLSLLADGADTPCRVVQQIGGESLRLPADAFAQALKQSYALRQTIQRFMLALLHQTAQNAACNVRHSVEERMCRWLLACRDRIGGDEFRLTQEFLSEMLGVRRQSVNLAAGALQRAGLISYSRGHLKILDRTGLERAACECYRATKEAYERLLQLPTGRRE